jgi:hypothetical protein
MFLGRLPLASHGPILFPVFQSQSAHNGGVLLDILVFDHLIITEGYYSFADSGAL